MAAVRLRECLGLQVRGVQVPFAPVALATYSCRRSGIGLALGCRMDTAAGRVWDAIQPVFGPCLALGLTVPRADRVVFALLSASGLRICIGATWRQ